jgi:hypothetical protein
MRRTPPPRISGQARTGRRRVRPRGRRLSKRATSVSMFCEGGDALAQILGTERAAHGRADDGAQELLFGARACVVFWRVGYTHMRRGAERDDADENALDLVEPLVGDRCRLLRERREGFGACQKRREPFEPEQHPALGALKAKLGNGWGGGTHARKFMRAERSVGLILVEDRKGKGLAGKGVG